MNLTQAEVEATVKEVLDKLCRDRHGCMNAYRTSAPTDCWVCDDHAVEAREIALALAEKYLEKHRYVPPREATDSVTNEQALAGLKVEGKHGS